MDILNQLTRPTGPYEFKGVGSPEYDKGGGDIKIRYSGDSVDKLSMSSKTYIEWIYEKIERLEWNLKGFMNPIDPNFHAEIDDSEFLISEDNNSMVYPNI